MIQSNEFYDTPQKKSFVLYYDSYEFIKDLSPEESKELLQALFLFRENDSPTFTSRATDLIFKMLKQQLIRDREKWLASAERSRANGKRGGRPKGEENPVGFEETEQVLDKPRKPDNVNDTVNVKENVNDTLSNTRLGESEVFLDKYKELVNGLIDKTDTEKSQSIKAFIIEHNPTSIYQPYFDLWNLLAKKKGLDTVSNADIKFLSKSLTERFKQDGADFLKILTVIETNNFYTGNGPNKWKVNLYYILESDSNWLKIQHKFKEPKPKLNTSLFDGDLVEKSKKYENYDKSNSGHSSIIEQLKKYDVYHREPPSKLVL